jgi:hypothetical protein
MENECLPACFLLKSQLLNCFSGRQEYFDHSLALDKVHKKARKAQHGP